MILVDTHCHVQDEKFDEDRDDVLKRALDALSWLVLIGNDLESSRRGLALARDRIYAAVGVHPYHAAEVDDDGIAALRAMAANPYVVAIGEIGLDYFKYCETPKPVQHAAFRRQLELAADLRLPVVIHNRESSDDLGGIVEEYAPNLAGGVLHCFAGSPDFALRGLSWGFYISFAGNLTFPNAHELRDVAAIVPSHRLLVETDSPYLAPVPQRGKRCEPMFVERTAEALARIRGITLEELATITTANAERLFRPAARASRES
jgi:TatD DNase family protein